MDEHTIVVVGDDANSRKVASMLARHNIAVLSAGLAAGLPLDMLTDFCIPLDRTKPKLPPPPSEQDLRAMAAAEAKRQRRAAKLRALAAPKDATG